MSRPFKQHSQFVMTFIILIFFASCASVDYKIKDQYIPNKYSISNTNDYKIKIEVTYKPTLTKVPKSIGVKKNGYGWEMAHIYLDTLPAYWLKEVISLEFEKAGFIIVDENEPNAVSVNINAKQIFVEPGVGFWSADLASIGDMQVEVILPNSNKTFQRRFVTISSSNEMIWTDNDFKDGLFKAIKTSNMKVVEGVYELLLSKHGGLQ